MLEMTVGTEEVFDESTSTFQESGGTSIRLEHSLFAISKWEAKWKQAFLGAKKKSVAMVQDYVYDMMLDPKPSREILDRFSDRDYKVISDYLNDSQTASVINEVPSFGGDGSEAGLRSVTSETIYAKMIVMNVPIEFQYWNINRLLTLLRVIDIELNPERKLNSAQAQQWQREENKRRRQLWNSKG